MVIQDTYHGQQMQPGRPALGAPPMPEDRPGHLPEIILHGQSIAGLEPGEIRRLRAAGAPDPERTYAHVQLIGNYSLGCIDTQTLDYYNIAPEAAHHLAWEAFGRCVHVIAYYDENDRLVAGE